MQKPTIKYTPPDQIIPTTEQVKQIISVTKTDYTLIFTLMAEIAVEGEELHKVTTDKIDLTKAEISIIGTKGHNNKVYPLKPQTANMLRNYLSKHPENQPFPQSKNMGKAWAYARNTASQRYCNTQLKTIQMKNLRNYAGAQYYLDMTRGKHDPIQTMRFMRHKKLETTLHYINTINLDEPQLFTSIQIDETDPTAQKRIKELSDAGYNHIITCNKIQTWRILQTNTL